MDMKYDDFEMLNNFVSSITSDMRSYHSEPFNRDLLGVSLDFSAYYNDRYQKNNTADVPEKDVKELVQNLINGIITSCKAATHSDTELPVTDQEKRDTIRYADFIMNDLQNWAKSESGKKYDALLGDIIRDGQKKFEDIKNAQPTFEDVKNKLEKNSLALVEKITKDNFDNDAKYIADNINPLLEGIKDSKGYSELGTDTFATLRNMSAAIERLAAKTPLIDEETSKINPMFEQLYELNKTLDNFYRTNTSEHCMEEMNNKVSAGYSKAENAVDKNYFDNSVVNSGIIQIKNLKSFTDKNFVKEKKETHAEAANSALSRFNRLKSPVAATGEFAELLLEKKNINALKGTGSPEYTRLADAFKQYSASKSDENIKKLFEASRDYLLCKKDTPFSPEGKARVEAAAKVMGMTGVMMMEKLQTNKFGVNVNADALKESIRTDMFVECARNSTFRTLMAVQSPRLIEGGVTEMFDVMGYAVETEQFSNGKNAVGVLAGNYAEYKEIDGEMKIVENSRCQAVKATADQTRNVLESEIEFIVTDPSKGINTANDEVREKVDNLYKEMREAKGLDKKPAEKQPKQIEIPQIGGLGIN